MKKGGTKRIRRAVEAGLRRWVRAGARPLLVPAGLLPSNGQATENSGTTNRPQSKKPKKSKKKKKKKSRGPTSAGAAPPFPPNRRFWEMEEGDFYGRLPGNPKLKRYIVDPDDDDDVLHMQIQRQKEVFKVSRSRVLYRLLVWTWAAVRFVAGIVWLALRRKNTVKRQAVLLKKILIATGPTAIKLGQQLSMRVDLLPYAFTQEMEGLLTEEVPPFPFRDAKEQILKATGKQTLEETFVQFDRKPIGSASVACVYQAILKSGERVAVKVRRPDIGEVFDADLRVLSGVLKMLELLILPANFSKQIMYALRTMLMEELDFIMEARNAEIFRRAAKKGKFDYVSVPRVFFNLSNRTVLVTEFAVGIHVTDILHAVEDKDRQALADLRALGIKPKTIAQRTLKIIRYSGFEGLLFNADPHPGNILVQPNNNLVFIDFGSAGAFTDQDLAVWRRLLFAQSNDDVGGMVQAVIVLFEPLSAIDTDEFTRKLEALFFQELYATKSKHTEWWERTSANVWLKVLSLVREYGITVNLDVLRMIRATMLSDSLAARLYPKIDPYKEYRRYERGANQRAYDRLVKRVERDFTYRRWVTAEQLYQMSYTALFRLQQLLDVRIPRFTKMISRTAHFAAVLVKTIIAAFFGLFLTLFGWWSLDWLAAQTGQWYSWSGWAAIRDFFFAQAYVGGQGFGGVFDNLAQLAWNRKAYVVITFIVIALIANRVLRRINLLSKD